VFLSFFGLGILALQIVKRTMSASARTKIAAFQRARWAKVSRQKKEA
jgi:hypothetical protein